MRLADKIARLANQRTLALAGIYASSLPIWCSLTNHELKTWPAHEKQQYFLRQAESRRILRNFVRQCVR